MTHYRQILFSKLPFFGSDIIVCTSVEMFSFLLLLFSKRSTQTSTIDRTPSKFIVKRIVRFYRFGMDRP